MSNQKSKHHKTIHHILKKKLHKITSKEKYG